MENKLISLKSITQWILLGFMMIGLAIFIYTNAKPIVSDFKSSVINFSLSLNKYVREVECRANNCNENNKNSGTK